MKHIWDKESLSTALDIKINSEIFANKVQFNSQNVTEGDLFIALAGENGDGHDFIEDALSRGAAAIIASKPSENDSRIIYVTDTREALSKLATYKRNISKAKFIGITGSVGKTTTKELTSLLLSSYGKTFASRGNFNNKLGVEINLASMDTDAEYAVIEMGMNAKGEIKELTQIVKPDIAIVTNIAPVHLEFFNSVDDIADAKSEIFLGLDPEKGIAILNRSNEYFKRCLDHVQSCGIKQIKYFGYEEGVDVQFKSYEITKEYKASLIYTIKRLKSTTDIYVSANYIPEHIASNLAASFSVILSLNLEIEPAVKAARDFKLPIGRGQIVHVTKEGKSYQIITDYYNSGPKSLHAAIDVLALLEAKRKIIVMGDMRELGITSPKYHESAGLKMIDAGLNLALLVGEMVKHTSLSLEGKIENQIFANSDDLSKIIHNYVEDGDLILIKGSRGIKLEKIAKALGVENVF